MQIIPDPLVVALQLVPFLLTLAALHAIIFKPMLDYLDDRDKARVGGRDEAESLQARIEEKLADYQSSLDSAQNEVLDLRAERRTAAAAEADARLSEARDRAEAMVDQALTSIEQERVAAAAGIQASADQLADDIAGQVLGRSLQAG